MAWPFGVCAAAAVATSSKTGTSFIVLPHGLRGIAPVSGEPRITRRVLARVIRIEINEAALNQKVAHFEHVAPPAGVGHSRAPRDVLVFAEARALDRERIRA